MIAVSGIYGIGARHTASHHRKRGIVQGFGGCCAIDRVSDEVLEVSLESVISVESSNVLLLGEMVGMVNLGSIFCICTPRFLCGYP